MNAGKVVVPPIVLGQIEQPKLMDYQANFSIVAEEMGNVYKVRLSGKGPLDRCTGPFGTRWMTAGPVPLNCASDCGRCCALNCEVAGDFSTERCNKLSNDRGYRSY